MFPLVISYITSAQCDTLFSLGCDDRPSSFHFAVGKKKEAKKLCAFLFPKVLYKSCMNTDLGTVFLLFFIAFFPFLVKLLSHTYNSTHKYSFYTKNSYII
jgi:hypothetical protein